MDIEVLRIIIDFHFCSNDEPNFWLSCFEREKTISKNDQQNPKGLDNQTRHYEQVYG